MGQIIDRGFLSAKKSKEFKQCTLFW